MSYTDNPYPNPDAIARAKTLPDPRFGCWFCGAESVAIAPRHSGGDTDVPCHYIPVCTTHAADWYDDVPSGEEMGMIPRDGVFLTREQAESALGRLSYYVDNNDASVDEAEIEAVNALAAGIRGLDAF
jgi:hypothetical protein